jgi:hypothetical protein
MPQQHFRLGRMLSLIIALQIFCPAAFAADTWQAGTGRANITPQQLMWMAGYGARDHAAEGKLTDLWTKVLLLESPTGQTAVLITFDLVGIDRDLAFAIRNQLKEQYGWSTEQVMFCTSHTHTGPVVGRNLAPMHYLLIGAEQQRLVEAYGETLIQNVMDAVGQAVKSKSACQLSWGTGKTTFAVNRRNNRPEEEVPARRSVGQLVGPMDHDVPVLAVRNPDGKLRSVVFGYACHATVLSFYQWSGDYPGFAQIELEKTYPESLALFWAGCGADQNPLPRRTVELAEQYGRRLAQAVGDVLDAPMEQLGPNLTVAYSEVALPLATTPTTDELEKEAKSDDKYVKARAQMWLERVAQGQSLPRDYPYPVAAWHFGDQLEWCFLGGEVVVDYALRLKAERHQQRTWVAGYSNDVMAYIPSLRVLREGGYEGGGAMVYYGLLSPWGESCEEVIVKKVHEVAGR